MLISITTVNFSLSGHLIFEASEESDFGATSRRVSRTATLDGGCLITDQGFSHSDRTFRLLSKNPLSTAEIETLRSLHRDYALINAAVPEGVFQGVVESFRETNGFVTMTILVKEKI